MAYNVYRCVKEEPIMQNPDALTPIDEDEEDMEEEDPDDTPITMGKQHVNGGHLPQITHTAASPMNADPPSKPGEKEDSRTEADKSGGNIKELGEIKQIESVL